MRRYAIAFACGLLLAGLVAACGGEDEKAAKTTPTVTTETETEATSTATAPTATAPAPSNPRTTPPASPADPNSGGTTAPRGRRKATPPDGPGNDIPPEPGSPAERFERQCEQNPATCGD